MQLEVIIFLGKTLPSAKKFKNTLINAGRRCCCRSCQPRLYKHCVEV